MLCEAYDEGIQEVEFVGFTDHVKRSRGYLTGATNLGAESALFIYDDEYFVAFEKYADEFDTNRLASNIELLEQ